MLSQSDAVLRLSPDAQHYTYSNEPESTYRQESPLIWAPRTNALELLEPFWPHLLHVAVRGPFKDDPLASDNNEIAIFGHDTVDDAAVLQEPELSVGFKWSHDVVDPVGLEDL